MSTHTDAFETLAAMTGHPCPAAWMALMTAFPAGLAARTYPGLDDRVADYELLDNLDAVVALNEDIRADEVWGDGDEEDVPWTPERLAIGRDIGGDIVFLDTTRAHPPAERFLVSSGRIMEMGKWKMAPDINTFAAAMNADNVEAPRI